MILGVAGEAEKSKWLLSPTTNLTQDDCNLKKRERERQEEASTKPLKTPFPHPIRFQSSSRN